MDPANLVLFAFLAGAALLWWAVSSARQATEQATEAEIQAGGEIIARFGPIVLYDDPPRLDGPTGDDYWGEPREEFYLTPDTKATVEAAGNISVTRGRNLASKAVGGLMTGGVGFFAFGNAKERTTDARELYLIVEGSDWAYTRQLDPDHGALARSFAAAVNVAAKNSQLSEASPSDGPSADDPLERVQILARLRDTGALSQADFDAALNELLSR